jgi:hypothetical protein
MISDIYFVVFYSAEYNSWCQLWECIQSRCFSRWYHILLSSYRPCCLEMLLEQQSWQCLWSHTWMLKSCIFFVAWSVELARFASVLFVYQMSESTNHVCQVAVWSAFVKVVHPLFLYICTWLSFFYSVYFYEYFVVNSQAEWMKLFHPHPSKPNRRPLMK